MEYLLSKGMKASTCNLRKNLLLLILLLLGLVCILRYPHCRSVPWDSHDELLLIVNLLIISFLICWSTVGNRGYRVSLGRKRWKVLLLHLMMLVVGSHLHRAEIPTYLLHSGRMIFTITHSSLTADWAEWLAHHSRFPLMVQVCSFSNHNSDWRSRCWKRRL